MKVRTILKKTIILAILLLFLPGCFIFRRVGLKNCSYRLAAVKVKEIALTYLKLEVVIDVVNPNSIDVVVDRVNIDLYVNEDKIADANTSIKITIPANGEAKIRPVATVNYSEVGTAIISTIKNMSAKYKVIGTVYFDTVLGTFSFPITVVEGETN